MASSGMSAELNNELPPLPEMGAMFHDDWGPIVAVGFTEDQMHEYARSAVATTLAAQGAEPSGLECERWNFDATNEALLVCRNEHERSQGCSMQPMHPAEVLALVNDLRSRLLRSALTRPLVAAQVEPSDLHSQIMNLPRAPDAGLSHAERLAFKHGHKQARHAAAELVLALQRLT